MVDFSKVGWFPPNLPGEELSEDEDDEALFVTNGTAEES